MKGKRTVKMVEECEKEGRIVRKVEDCEKKGGYDQPVNGFFVFMNVYNHLTFWSPPGDIVEASTTSTQLARRP